MSSPAIYADPCVLAWCNEQREKYGLGPPLRRMPVTESRSGLDCPVALALECRTYVHPHSVRLGGDLIELPESVKQAIADFDARCCDA